MNMTEKNGQPSMEEILASIRRIIAEEPGQHNGELGGTPILLKGDGLLEDTSDFDLPAIFRASPPQVDRQSPLLGRLTDAIRNATAAHGDESSLHDSEMPANGRNGHNGHHQNGYHQNGHHQNGHQNGHHPALSSLLVRSGETGHANGASYAPETPASGAPSPAASALPGEEPKRVMAPFKDTHFLRMTQPVALAQPAPAEAEPSPEPEEVAPVVSAAPEPEPLPWPAALLEPEMPAPEHAASEAAAPAVTVPPPPLPMAAPMGEPAAAGGIEDATADLLRPMLRQWLADNMPRMVEKALHIEIAESVKPLKKP